MRWVMGLGKKKQGFRQIVSFKIAHIISNKIWHSAHIF